MTTLLIVSNLPDALFAGLPASVLFYQILLLFARETPHKNLIRLRLPGKASSWFG